MGVQPGRDFVGTVQSAVQRQYLASTVYTTVHSCEFDFEIRSKLHSCTVFFPNQINQLRFILTVTYTQINQSYVAKTNIHFDSFIFAQLLCAFDFEIRSKLHSCEAKEAKPNKLSPLAHAPRISFFDSASILMKFSFVLEI